MLSTEKISELFSGSVRECIPENATERGQDGTFSIWHSRLKMDEAKVRAVAAEEPAVFTV